MYVSARGVERGDAGLGGSFQLAIHHHLCTVPGLLSCIKPKSPIALRWIIPIKRRLLRYGSAAFISSPLAGCSSWPVASFGFLDSPSPNASRRSSTRRSSKAPRWLQLSSVWLCLAGSTSEEAGAPKSVGIAATGGERMSVGSTGARHWSVFLRSQGSFTAGRRDRGSLWATYGSRSQKV